MKSLKLTIVTLAALVYSGMLADTAGAGDAQFRLKVTETKAQVTAGIKGLPQFSEPLTVTVDVLRGPPGTENTLASKVCEVSAGTPTVKENSPTEHFRCQLNLATASISVVYVHKQTDATQRHQAHVTITDGSESNLMDLTQPPSGLSGPGLGEAVNFDFAPDSTVAQVLAVLRAEFLTPGTVEQSFLAVTITSINGTNHFHGTDIIPLTDVTIFSQAGELVDVVYDWTEDNEPQVIGDVYTICSTLHTGTEVGPERCQSFGPF